MPPDLTVALLGLPGAGKSTLCRRLAARLGWTPFILGDALRAQAASDSALAQRLAHGDLAPEFLALDLIRGVAAKSHGQKLILDGFPRHTGQIQFARELFSPLLGLHLDAPPGVVALRLAIRRNCRLCGWAGTVAEQIAERCPACHGFGLQWRPEDEPEPLFRRLGEAGQRLHQLLLQWGNIPMIRIDASVPPEDVLEQSISTLRTYLDHSGNT